MSRSESPPARARSSGARGEEHTSAAKALSELDPEAMAALVRLARAVSVDEGPSGSNDEGQLPENFIADVVDGASRRGVEMRHTKSIQGPFRHGDGWRNRAVLMTGQRKWLETYGTKEEAQKAKVGLTRATQIESVPTVDGAIDEYGKYLATIENQSRSIETTLGRLRSFFSADLKEKCWRISPQRAARLKADLDTRPSRQGPPGSILARETRRGTLAEVKTFANWAAGAERGYMKPGVFAEIKLDTRRGGKKVRRSRGKPQLREFERVKWYAKALELAGKGDEAALAALIALDGGLRSGEITGRMVRDIDRNGGAIVVENGKTESSDRTRDLSPEVAELLRRHIADRSPDAPLFPGVAGLHDPKAWLLRSVTRICKLAGVPRVTPHGLRGTSATQGLLRIVLQLVSAQHGHAESEVTRQHYITPEGFAEAERILARATVSPATARA